MVFKCKDDGIKCEKCPYFDNCLNNGLIEYIFNRKNGKA